MTNRGGGGGGDISAEHPDIIKLPIKLLKLIQTTQNHSKNQRRYSITNTHTNLHIYRESNELFIEEKEHHNIIIIDI